MLIAELDGRLVGSGTIARDAREFHLPMAQSQLGDYSGLSAVNINRVLKAIRDDEMAPFRSQRMVTHDLDAPGRVADPLRDLSERTNSASGGDASNRRKNQVSHRPSSCPACVRAPQPRSPMPLNLGPPVRHGRYRGRPRPLIRLPQPSPSAPSFRRAPAAQCGRDARSH